jgi:hypothetical protein
VLAAAGVGVGVGVLVGWAWFQAYRLPPPRQAPAEAVLARYRHPLRTPIVLAVCVDRGWPALLVLTRARTCTAPRHECGGPRELSVGHTPGEGGWGGGSGGGPALHGGRGGGARTRRQHAAHERRRRQRCHVHVCRAPPSQHCRGPPTHRRLSRRARTHTLSHTHTHTEEGVLERCVCRRCRLRARALT